MATVRKRLNITEAEAEEDGKFDKKKGLQWKDVNLLRHLIPEAILGMHFVKELSTS